VADPLNRKTAYASNQTMRAASTAAPTPGADPNRISQDGDEIPALILNTRDFIPGGGPEGLPQPPPSEMVETRPALPADAPDNEERPPDPKNAVKTDDPLAPAPANEKNHDHPVIEPPLRDRSPDPLSLADAPSIRKIQDPVTPGGNSPHQAKGSVSSVKTKSIGAVKLRAGEAGADAVDSPVGRYQAVVRERVGAILNARLAAVRGLAGAGVVEVEYDIDAKGNVSGVKLVDPGKANAVFEDVCLTAIIKVKLPTPPDEWLSELRDPLSSGKVHCTFTFFRL
jgi:outer membrane biosynthesis protein TonB